jgi:hypothetical protein
VVVGGLKAKAMAVADGRGSKAKAVVVGVLEVEAMAVAIGWGGLRMRQW